MMGLFIGGGYAVVTDNQNIKDFIQICDGYGLRWADGTDACGFTPRGREHNVAISCHDGSMRYAGASYYQNRGLNIINFEEVLESDGSTDCDKDSIDIEGLAGILLANGDQQ